MCAQIGRPRPARMRGAGKNVDFVLKMFGFCIEMFGFCSKYVRFCSYSHLSMNAEGRNSMVGGRQASHRCDFALKTMNFVLKMMNFALK